MPVVHVRNHESSLVFGRDVPECSTKGLLLAFAGPGDAITCKKCIAVTGMHFLPGVKPAQISGVVALSKDEKPEIEESAVTSMGFRMLAKEQKVRVIQVSRYEANLNDTMVVLERRTVAFNGSAAAYVIWNKTHTTAYFYGSSVEFKIEFGKKGEWDKDAHSFAGFSPINSGVRIANVIASKPNEDKLRKVIEWSPTKPDIDDRTAKGLEAAFAEMD